MSVMFAMRGACARGGVGRFAGGERARGAVGRWRCAGALLVLAVCACAAVPAQERDSQLAPAPFILGSRFGRSPQRLLAPRNDKFFLSSRYGKRSELAALPPPLPPAAAAAPPGTPRAAPALLCDYTGLGALYRCRPQRRHRDDRRLWDETSSEDE